MYEVIHYFTDLQDNEYPYNVGDVFPRDELTVSEERLKELSGSQNLQKRPLIKKVEEDKQYTKTDIRRMKLAELQELASENEIDDAYDMTGEELKDALIGFYGL